MKKLSKLVALLLAVVMIVTMLPVMASADETPAEVVENVETPLESADQAEEAPETAAPAEETVPAETPAEEPAAETTPAEEITPAAETPKAEETPFEAPKAEETAPAELIAAEKPELLVGADEVGTVDVESYSNYASFTRTFTEEDLTQKAASKKFRATNSSGAVAYYDDLATAITTEGKKAYSGRVITFLDDFTTTTAVSFPSSAADWGNAFEGDLTIDLNGYTWTVSGNIKAANSTHAGYTIRNGRITATENANTIFNLGTTGGNNIGKTEQTVNYDNIVATCKCGFVCAYALLMTINITNCDIWNNSYGAAMVISTIKQNFNDNNQDSCVNISNSFIGSKTGAIVNFTNRQEKNNVNYDIVSLNSLIDVSNSALYFKTDLTRCSTYVPTEHITGDAELTSGTASYTPLAPYNTEVTELNSYVGDLFVYFDYNPNAEYETVFFVDDEDNEIATQSVANGDSPEAYAAPNKVSGGQLYAFDYWTTEDDDTHYSASDLTSYIVTGTTTFTAHYVEADPVASFTENGSDEETFFFTFKDALAESNTFNGNGWIKLYDDVQIPDEDASSDSRTFSLTKNLNIDFNGHYFYSTKGNPFHLAAANLTLNFKNGAIIAGSATNSGHVISISQQKNAVINLTDMDLYCVNTFSSAGSSINMQSALDATAPITFTATRCRFLSQRQSAAIFYYCGSTGTNPNYSDATFTDCTFVTLSAGNSNAFGDFHLDVANSVMSLTLNGTNTYYTKSATATVFSENLTTYATIETNGCGFAKTENETWDNTDRYATTAAKITELIGDSALSGLSKFTQAAASTVTFLDDDGVTVLAEQNITSGAAITAYAAPEKAGNGNFYTFDYWTAEGDETHYSAEALTTYAVTGDVAFTAHYTLTPATASYTDGNNNVTYYTTLEAAINASNAANTTYGEPIGKVTLLRDYTNNATTGPTSTYMNRIGQSIDIDFGGHVYNVPHMSPLFFTGRKNNDLRMVVRLHNGTVMGMSENYTSASASTNTGYATYCSGALISNGVTNCDFTFTDLNIICLSPNGSYALTTNEQTEYAERSTYTFNNCVVLSTNSYIMRFGGSSATLNYMDYFFNNTKLITLHSTRRLFDVPTTGWNLTFDADCEFFSSNAATISAAELSNVTVNEPAGYAEMSAAAGFDLSTALSGDALAIANASLVYTGSGATLTSEPVETALASVPHRIYAPAVTITWKFGDTVIRTDTVAIGDTPTAPAANDLSAYEFDTLIGWNTDSSAEIGMEIPVAAEDATYYLIATSSASQTVDSKVKLTIDGNSTFYSTLTRAITVAENRDEAFTIDLLDNVTMDIDTDECGTGGTSGDNYWFTFDGNLSLTLNLNGYTISSGTNFGEQYTYGTEGYMYGDRALFMFAKASGSNATVNISGGTLKTEGKRQILSFGTSTQTRNTDVLSLSATNVNFVRETADGNTMLICAYAHCDTAPFPIELNGCSFTCNDTENSIDTAISFAKAANIGNYPVTVSMIGCSFDNVGSVYSSSKLDLDATHPRKTQPQITIDPATAQNIFDQIGGCISERDLLNAADMSDSVTEYVVNPMTMTGDVYNATFALDAISMSLQDYVYVNVKPNDAWTADYSIITSMTSDAFAGNDTTQIGNLPITAKEMGDKFTITIFADNGTTRYLSGTYGSIDTFADLTSQAASGSAANELVAAMEAMKTYGDWAAYNFDTTDTVAQPATVDYDVSGIAPVEATGKSNTASGLAGYYGTSAVLGDQLYLKHYFYKLTELTGSVSVVPADIAADTTYDCGVDRNGKFGTVKIKIMPRYFDTAYTVSVNDGAYTATGSLASYAAALSTRGSEKEQTLAKALLAYCKAAQTYFQAAES